MTWSRRVLLLLTGLLAGLVAAVAMLLLMAAARTWLGISPLPESIPDRIAPTLSISHFFSLFGKYGGYNGLKKFGVSSGIKAIFGAGAVVGVIYALIVETRKARSWGSWRGGFSRLGLLLLGALVLVMWIGTAIFLRPVLQMSFRGLPPTQARYVTLAGLLIDYLVFAAVLLLTYRFVAVRIAAPRAEPATTPDAIDQRHTAASELVPPGRPVARRAVLAAGVGVLLAYPANVLFKRLYDRAVFPYDGLSYNGPGIQPIVPNDRFYAVTKNVVDPNVDKSVWGLEISGLVDHPKTFSFDDLAAMPSIQQETTLMCISNSVGSGLMSNAVWTGVRMRDLLNAAVVKSGAVEVKLYGADGYTDTFAIEKALSPTTLIVYKMNGQELAERHGYPVRLIVPGLYGEKNVKWVTGIEVIDHDGKGFYETQGWGPDFVVHPRSDFFAPKLSFRISKFVFDSPFKLNQPVKLQGRGFAGDKGVKSVEISLDNGATWHPTQFDYPGTKLTWVFWSYEWTPTAAGDYVLICRATDGDGNPQTPDGYSTVPQGASGYFKINARVE